MKTNYRLIMLLPAQFARGTLHFILLPLFESGLKEERIQRALDPLFKRGPVPVRTGRRAKVGMKSGLVTDIASDCSELSQLHLAAWTCVVHALRATIIHPSLCREGFQPFVRDRTEGICPARAEFVCDTVVLDKLNFGRDGRDPVKTWRLQ